MWQVAEEADSLECPVAFAALVLSSALHGLMKEHPYY